MASNSKYSAQVYACPDCDGKLVVSPYATECRNCGRDPRHD